MFSPTHFLSPGRNRVPGYEDDDHEEFSDRLCKTFYYGKLPTTDRPSLPLTDIAVEFFQEAAPRKLGRLDTYLAASTSRSACISPCSVMVGMLYVKRLKKSNPFYLQQVSSSDLFLISMMMASKFMYDEGIDDEVFNDEWAESADQELSDVNQLERDFLTAIDWNLFVYQQEFADVLNCLEQQIALRQGRDRGWFTYSDIDFLATNRNLQPLLLLASDMTKVLAVSSLAYLAGILTMIGSTIIVTTATTTLVAMAPGMLLPISSLAPLVPILSQENSIPLRATNLTFDLPESEFDPLTLNDELLTQSTQTQTGQSVKLSGLETGNKGEETETVSETARTSENWTNVLSPLLALFTLKDSFVNFVMAAVSEISYTSANQSMKTRPTGLVCSRGPCRQESWTDCWNVTTEEETNTDYESDMDSMLGRSRCCGNCGSRSKVNAPMSRSSDATCAGGIKELKVDPVKCCCRGTGGWDSVSLVDPRDISFMNEPYSYRYVNLGFSTASWYPTLVTT